MQKLLLFVLTLLCSTDMFSQQTHTWKDRKLAIALLDEYNFKISQNTKESFVATGDKQFRVEFYLYPEAEELKEMTSERTSYAAGKLAKMGYSKKNTQIDNQIIQAHLQDGYAGEGGLRMLFLGAVDKATGLNFYVAITYKRTTREDDTKAMEMLNSLKRVE